MKKSIFILAVSALLLSSTAHAQMHMLSGYVYDDEMTPLAGADIRFKETQLGARTDEKGFYEIKLEKGRYEVYISSKGYKSYKTYVVIKDGDVEKNFLLTLNLNIFDEATVTAAKKDISKRIIKNVIEEKKKNTVLQYSYDAYVLSRVTEDSTRIQKLIEKAEEREEKIDKKRENKEPSDTSAHESSYEIKRSIGEASLHVVRARPDKISEKREAIKISGDKGKLYYMSARDGEFDFLQSLMYLPSLGETPFLSPFSTNGLIMYRYEMLDIQDDGYGLVYHISFRPNSIANNLIEGEVWVTDKTWKLLKIEASFPDHLTPEFSEFSIEAEYEEVEYSVYLPTTFDFRYQKVGYPHSLGHTHVSFENYTMDSVIDRQKFSSMISQTLEEAYDKDSTFWNSRRTIPLTADEVAYLQRKDSLQAFYDSDHFKDSVETERNTIRFVNIAWNGQHLENWRKEVRWYIPSLPEIINPLAPGGVRIAPGVSYYKKFLNKKELRIYPTISYGTLNKDWMYSLNSYALIDPIRRTSVYFRMGKSMDNMFWSDAIANVLSRTNFYLKNMYSVRGYTEIANGLQIGLHLEWARRKSISDYKFYDWWDEVIDPDSTFNNTPVFFEPYNAMFGVFSLEYTPGQMYVMEPYEKIILGSKWPTFYVNYKKGLKGVLGSVIDYDYLQAGIKQKVNLGSIGISQYNLMFGNFFNENNVELVDHKRIAKGNPGIFFNPMYSFQSMDSTFSLFQGFVEGHYRHDFNGFLISKIPYASKLKITSVAGLSLLHAPERDLEYIEFYAGLEKILTIFRVRVKLGFFGVQSFSSSFKNPPQFKIGISVYDTYKKQWN